ncbi:MAG: 50S ribosomal protein L1 [Armatimonadetes bacterium]|nr:50S ribosomal protein L1 [Armatimonadota bacterium]
MARHSKRYLEAAKLVDKTQLYSLEEAVELVKKTSQVKFDPAVEVAIRLGVDPSKGEQTVRGSLTLPHGTGRTPRVVVFAKGEAAEAAEAAGADRAGGDDLIEAIDGGWSEFDVLVAHASIMREVGKLGKKLGPRMPNKKAGTIAATPEELGSIVRELKSGRVEFKMDRGAVLHVSVGRASFETSQLLENLDALIGAVVQARPSAAKGRYLIGIAIASTMGPGVKIDVQDALRRAA